MPGDDTRVLASMGNYVFTTSTLVDVVTPSTVEPGGHRPRRRRDPGADRQRRRPHVRLLDQRHPRPGGARAGLLARRRDARRLLRGQHGPARRAAAVQPLQPGVAGLQPAAPAAAGQDRLRLERCRGQRRQQPAVRRRHRVRRHRRALDPRPGRAHRGRRRGQRVASCCRASGSPPGPASTGASSTRTSTFRRATGWASTAGSIHRSSPGPTTASSSSRRTTSSTDRVSARTLDLAADRGLSAQRVAVGTAPPSARVPAWWSPPRRSGTICQRASSAVSPEGAPRRRWCTCWWSTTRRRSAPRHGPS